MSMDDSPSTPASDPGLRNQRRHGRLVCSHLVCRHGSRTFATVLDMSASGLRVLRKGGCRYKAGDYLGLSLVWFDTILPAKVRIEWVRRAGFRKHLIGLEFVDASPAFKTGITHLIHLAHTSMAHARAALKSA